MESVIGYVASGLIGISLGLIGGGGSILTVPVLVYLFHVEPTLATAYSLFIVGITAFVGGLQSAINRMVDFRTAAIFAIPSFVSVYLTRRYVLPIIPDQLITLGDTVITRDMTIMVFFATVMFLAAVSMIRRKQQHTPTEYQFVSYNYPLIMVEGIVVGVITGVVGAGGGFLIIPALVLLAKLPMKKAVGTSLVIIAAKSLVGFAGDLGANSEINFTFLAMISVIAVAGIFIGTYLSKYIAGEKLKSVFGWFVLVMSIYIITREAVTI